MFRVIRVMLVSISFVAAHALSAEELRLQGDLVLHPDQLGQVVSYYANQLSTRNEWVLPGLQFTRPYKIEWKNIKAVGPIQVLVDTDHIQDGELAFSLSWANPRIEIGSFQIHDIVERVVGGARFVLHLDGACQGLSMTVPEGEWHASGVLKWAQRGQQFQVEWKDFKFSTADVNPAQIDLGQCRGPKGIQAALRQAIQLASQDKAWIQELIRDGILNQLDQGFQVLAKELLKVRSIEVKPGILMSWRPRSLWNVGGGISAIDGDLVLESGSTSSTAGDTKIVSKSYDQLAPDTAKDSAFVLPKTALEEIVGFFYRSGELKYRVSTSEIPAFASLMKSRLLQFFVWPDLMNFATSTQFYFDVMATEPPKISGGRLGINGAAVYGALVPLAVRQWAPGQGAYFPYLDFASRAKGQLRVEVDNGALSVRTIVPSLNLTSNFRQEFISSVRAVNPRIAESAISARAAVYLSSQEFKFPLPTWTLGADLQLEMKSIQPWRQSFRVPLKLK